MYSNFFRHRKIFPDPGLSDSVHSFKKLENIITMQTCYPFNISKCFPYYANPPDLYRWKMNIDYIRLQSPDEKKQLYYPDRINTKTV